jgi:hypothetical protein
MNGKKAKAIRRDVYGDQSQREPRQYARTNSGGIINRPDSLRALYQKAKKSN